MRKLFVLQFMVRIFQNQSPMSTLYFGVGGVRGVLIYHPQGPKERTSEEKGSEHTVIKNVQVGSFEEKEMATHSSILA